jgi:hypothetical protein
LKVEVANRLIPDFRDPDLPIGASEFDRGPIDESCDKFRFVSHRFPLFQFVLPTQASEGVAVRGSSLTNLDVHFCGSL